MYIKALLTPFEGELRQGGLAQNRSRDERQGGLGFRVCLRGVSGSADEV